MICNHCKEQLQTAGAWQSAFGPAGAGLAHVYRGAGCAECRGTGFRGRIGIYELLVMTEEIRVELLRERGAGELRRIAQAGGMRTLREDGLRLVQAGVTTPEEVLRVTAS